MRAKITKRLLDGIDPSSLTDRLVVRDIDLPGFQARISPPSPRNPSGVKSYYIYYRDPVTGEQRRPKIGDHGVLTADQARERAREMLSRVALGMPADPAGPVARPQKTVADLVEDFIERHQRPRNDTWGEVAARLRRYVVPKWGARPALSITPADVDSLLRGVVDQGYPNVAVKLKSHLNRMFVWAGPTGDVPVPPPTAGIERPAPSNRRTRTLGDDEVRRIWRACDTLGYPGGRFVQLLFLLAQRREETSSLRRADVDETLAVWSQPGDSVKNEHPHLVPITAAARQILAAAPALVTIGPEGEDIPCTYFFSSDGRSYVRGYSKLKARLDEKSGVTGWWLHDIRRTVATNLARCGTDRFVIERVLNHADTSVTGRYDLWEYFEEKRASLDAWAGLLRRIIDPKRTGPATANGVRGKGRR